MDKHPFHFLYCCVSFDALRAIAYSDQGPAYERQLNAAPTCTASRTSKALRSAIFAECSGSAALAGAQHRNRDRGEAGQSNGARACRCQIDDPAANKWAPIGDTDDDTLAVSLVDDADPSPERQRPVSSRQSPGIHPLAVGRPCRSGDVVRKAPQSLAERKHPQAFALATLGHQGMERRASGLTDSLLGNL